MVTQCSIYEYGDNDMLLKLFKGLFKFENKSILTEIEPYMVSGCVLKCIYSPL